jgi:hypothetical protein
MSAKVFSSAGSFRPAPPNFTATCNLSPAPPTTNQFSFKDEDGHNVANLVWVDATTTISITLSDGANFSASTPIEWSLPPDGGTPTVALNGNMLSFEVPPPQNVFHPWVFKIVADVPGVTGIRSQNVYLAKPANVEQEEFILKYSFADGSFSLLDSISDSNQDGIILGEELVMVNVQCPRTFSVSLRADPSPSSSVAFAASNPVAWSSGLQPDWVDASRVAPDVVQFTLSYSALGQLIGFQFFIEITQDGQTVGVLSPDPILINTTIGDGG